MTSGPWDDYAAAAEAGPWDDYASSPSETSEIAPAPAREPTTLELAKQGFNSEVRDELGSIAKGYADDTAQLQQYDSLPWMRRLGLPNDPAKRQQRIERNTAKLAELTPQIAEYDNRVQATPASTAVEKVNKAGGWGATLKAAAESPLDYLKGVGVPSLVSSAGDIPNIIAAGLAGGPAAAMVAGGVTAGQQDYDATVLGELQNRGVDTRDPTQLQAALGNKALMAEISQFAEKRAGIVGATAGLSTLVGGKVLAPIAAGPLKRELVNVAAQAPLQASIDAAGEAAAQYASAGKITPSEVLGEAVGGGLSAPVDVAQAALGGYREQRGQNLLAPKSDPSFDAARGQMAEQDGAIVAPSGAVLGPEADARKAWAQASQEERAAWLSGSEDGEADQAAMLDQVSSQGSTPQATGPDLENFGNEDLPADVVRREFLTENGYIEGGDGSISTKDGPVAGPELDQLMTFLADADDVTQQMEAEGLLVTPQTVREELRRRQRVLDLQGDLATAQTPEAKAIVQKQIDAASAGRTAPAGDLEALATAAESRGDKDTAKAYREAIKEITDGTVADRSSESGSGDVERSVVDSAGAGSVPAEPESARATTEVAPAGATSVAVGSGASEQVAGVGDQEPISVLDPEWAEFAPETGTLAVPRADMPQIKAEHRGAMVNFLNARGVAHEIERDVDPAELKPTQAEYSKAKVEQARGFEGGDRAILVSSDGHVVDGHHQWLAAQAEGKPIKVIKLDAPARDLLPLLNEFPSSQQDAGLPDADAVLQPEPKKTKAAKKQGGKPAVSRLKAFQNERLTDERVRGDLEGMAGTAGWAQIGGQMIRSAGTGESSGRTEPGILKSGVGEVTGRTQWIPNAPWFKAVQGAAPLIANKNGKATQEAVRRALAGEPMTAAQKNHVQAMLAELDAVDVEVAARLERYGEEFDAALSMATAADARAENSADNALPAINYALVQTATEIDEGAVERAAMQAGEDDAVFMAAIQEIINGRAEGARADRASGEQREEVQAGADREKGSRAEEGRGREAEGLTLTAQSTPPVVAKPQPRPSTDLFGAVPVSQQAIADRQREQEASRNGTKDVPAGVDGGLFSDRQKQQDIADAPPKPDVSELPADGKLKDYGEKMAGARKDRQPSLGKMLSDADIRSQPLTEIWPLSDIAAIDDTFAAAVATAARAEIPAKPRVRYKLDAWVKKVRSVRELAQRLNEGDLTRETFEQKMTGFPALAKFAAKVRLLALVDRSLWGRIGAVAEYPNAYRYEGDTQIKTPLVSVEIDGASARFSGKSVDEVRDQISAALATEAETRIAFEIRSSTKTGEYFIVKKGDSEYRPLAKFKELKDAREHLKSNYAEVLKAWEDVKTSDNVKKTDVRRDENRERSGVDHRDGKDITPEQLSQTFGFRGIEFGNWVAQGAGGKDRQGLLNQVYDGLMDLADIIKVPPRALSLNGSLGLALGSRGSGNAAAHFEPSNLVINLTKTKGAGSLAHEWFHALDNYFARQRGGEKPIGRGDGAQQAYRDSNYITYRPEPLYVHKTAGGKGMSYARLEQMRMQNPNAAWFKAENWIRDPNHSQGVRPEVEQRFADLVNALDASPMTARASKIDKDAENGYWSRIIERGARSFENYVINKMAQQGVSNDFLANVVDAESFGRSTERYPYLKPEEEAPIVEAFDVLFSTIETKADENGNVAMFNRAAARRAVPEASAADVNQAQRIVDTITATWANKPTIKVIASMQDQAVPEAARLMDAEQKAGGAMGEVGGFIYRNEVYINAAASADPRQIVKTLYHEALGHFGLRAVFGPQMAEELKRVAFLRAKDVKAKLLEYGMADNSENRLKAAEEVLARLAETDPKLPLVQRVLAAIRSFLRPILSKLGITLELSDAELIRDYLIPARNYVRRGSAPETLGGELAFSRADDHGEKVAILRKAVEQVANGAEEAIAVGLRPDLVALGGSPDVAISWGNAKYGLSKIGARRGTEVVGKVLRAVALGTIERHSDAKKTVLLAHEGGRAVLSLDENGKRKTWLLTGWEEGRPDAAGEVRTQSGATQTDPTFGRADLVAGLDEMLPPSSADDNAAVDFSRNEPDQPSFTEENRRIREEHRGLWIKGKQFLRRQLLPGGLLPEAVFKEKMVRDNESQAIEFDIRHIVGNLDKMLMKDYGRRFDSLSMADQKKLMDGLAGKLDPSIPEGTSTALVAMRQYIDAQSTEYVDILQKKLDAKLADDPDSKDAKLIETIKGNFGNYVHRSYRAFDDSQWFRKVTDPTINAARDYLIGRYVESGASQAEAKRVAEVTLNEILKTGTAYESLDAFISEGKLGAKDLSVLIKRKQIAPQIRALLGEYIDPRISFTKSATKMGRLIWNQRFLDRVREVGVGSFLFEGKDRPPEATAQLAAEGSEAYAPLNGLWTTPDVKQAFVDALGKPVKENGIYTAAVAMTSLVKYGKTVLSPTTAARNWQSAMFFSLANGHFDLSQMSKSIAAFREQVSQNANAGQLEYLRKLKVLGVVYDTAQAGEMMDRIRDAKLEFWLKTRTGGLLRSVTKANDIARGFYSFGDDFWKIIGFENEKAALIKAGLAEAEAEKEAAERIRNTYPTYSLVGRGVKALGRFPLIGTFVSFPSEIIRTTSNMLRYTAKDLRSDNPKMRLNGAKRMVGMALVSAGFYALGAYTKALFGIDDDEEEAVRDLAPPWQKNSTFLYVGRDDKGNLRYFDLSFLDPYGYLKRPLTAMMRDQPWEDAAASGLWDMLSPFLGTDITTGAVMEVVTNKKESGGPVYRKYDTFGSQTWDITQHLSKALLPGFATSGYRVWEAAREQKKASGQPYVLNDELMSLVGWRASTLEPRTALYYRTFEFNDAISDARKALTEVIKDPNAVTEEDIKDGYDSAYDLQRRAFVSMRRVMAAAQKSGMTKRQVNETLSASGVSSGRVFDLINDRVPRVEFSDQAERDMINRTRLTKGKEAADEVRRRYGVARKLARQPQTSTRP